MQHITSANLEAGVVLTPHLVELELVLCVEQLELVQATITRLSYEQERVDTDLELNLAKAEVRSQAGSERLRKAEALLACEDGVRESRLLAAKLRLARETAHNLRATLDAVRSVGASVRAGMFEGGSAGPSGGSRPRT